MFLQIFLVKLYEIIFNYQKWEIWFVKTIYKYLYYCLTQRFKHLRYYEKCVWQCASKIFGELSCCQGFYFFIWVLMLQFHISAHVCWSATKICQLSLQNSEAVTRRCSGKRLFLNISQNSQGNTYPRVSFLIKLYAWGLQLY